MGVCILHSEASRLLCGCFDPGVRCECWCGEICGCAEVSEMFVFCICRAVGCILGELLNESPFSQGRMTSNSFAVCFASWAPPALKSGRFVGPYGGEGWDRCPLSPQELVSPLAHTFSPVAPQLPDLPFSVLAQLRGSSCPAGGRRAGPCPIPCLFQPVPGTHTALTQLGTEVEEGLKDGLSA